MAEFEAVMLSNSPTKAAFLAFGFNRANNGFDSNESLWQCMKIIVALNIVGQVSDKFAIFHRRSKPDRQNFFQKLLDFNRSEIDTDRLMQENSDTETLHQRIAELLKDMPIEEIRKLISEIEENMIPESGSRV